jgi:hypothetical protein
LCYVRWNWMPSVEKKRGMPWGNFWLEILHACMTVEDFIHVINISTCFWVDLYIL